jgi:hypothetical protein
MRAVQQPDDALTGQLVNNTGTLYLPWRAASDAIGDTEDALATARGFVNGLALAGVLWLTFGAAYLIF